MHRSLRFHDRNVENVTCSESASPTIGGFCHASAGGNFHVSGGRSTRATDDNVLRPLSELRV